MHRTASTDTLCSLEQIELRLIEASIACRQVERIEVGIRSMMEHLASPQLKRFKQIKHIIEGESPDVWAALSFLHEYQEGWNFASKTDVLQAWLYPPKQAPEPSPKTVLSRDESTWNKFSLLSIDQETDGLAEENEWIDVAADEPLEEQPPEGERLSCSGETSQYDLCHLTKHMNATYNSVILTFRTICILVSIAACSCEETA